MNRRPPILLAALLALASLVVPGTAAAATTTAKLVATDDSYVVSNASTHNYGTSQKLLVDHSPLTRSYLKFNVASIKGTITAATLRLTVATNSAPGFDLRGVGSTTWTERSLTYVNKPSLGTSVGHSPSSLRSKQVVSFNVLSSISRGISAFALVDLGSSTTLSLWSSEAATVSLRPTLTLTYQPFPPPPGPCGKTSTPAPVQHVIWIWMENHGYGQIIGSPSAPFENLLAAQCGLATNFFAETHPSLPNYIAATSGDTQGVTDDGGPDVHPLAVESIFSQVVAVGKEWRSYQEDMPGNCPLAGIGPYAVKHDPAAYYTGIRADCLNWDVPMGTTTAGNFLNDLNNNALPAFAFVTPNLCNDTHDCSRATGDAWLSDWFAKIIASPGYLDGSTVVVLTWDEDERTEGNRIPTIVVSPSTPVGTVSATSFNHYSLLKTTEELLGIATFLGHAADPGTNSMRAAFNL